MPLEFSGEEANGRYLDLHAFHYTFQNGAFGRQLDYIVYVSEIGDFASVPRDKKFTRAYSVGEALYSCGMRAVVTHSA